MKIGHGGTLDPLATGVLIIGVGKGTKHLGKFLECTKSYECVVLFGAATDSYDAVGKVVSRAGYEHVTKELVEEKLAQFRGKIQQKPSVFSALKVDGKKMYEYAREGGDIPEVAARPVEVNELELVEWLEPGTHEYKWPEEEVGGVEREGAEKLMGIREKDAKKGRGRKRSRSVSMEKDDDQISNVESQPKKPKTDDEPAMSGALPVGNAQHTDQPTEIADGDSSNTHASGAHSSLSAQASSIPDPDKAAPEATTTVAGESIRPEEPEPEPEQMDVAAATDENPSSGSGIPAVGGVPGSDTATTEEQPPEITQPSTSTDTPTVQPVPSEPQPQPPAARLRMTVTSGFYVRSLCHDLGLACNSLGLMSSLIRSRQGDYVLGENVLEYSDLEAGAEVWEPKVQKYLEEFMEKEGWETEEVEDEESWEKNRKEREGERRERDRDTSYRGGKSKGNWKGNKRQNYNR